jgi:hypothetical protein
MIVIKEEFVGGEKWRRAVKLHADAIVMWLALKCYASQHPSSEGFIPDEDIRELPGAPKAARKALDALVDCGRLLPDGRRGPGLVDRAEGGWKLHDYLDHSATPEEMELRREKARLKKARQREEKRRELEYVRSQALDVSRDVSRGHQGDAAGHVPGDALADARPPAPAHTRGRARSQPNPLKPSQTPFSSEEREALEPEPSSGTRAGPKHARFPVGWRWSLETSAEAVALGLGADDLQDHVDYWTPRSFAVPVDDLDGKGLDVELRRSLKGIAERKRKGESSAAPPQAPPAPDPYAWAPTDEHRAFAKAQRLELPRAIAAYRAARMPEKFSSTLRANEDFMRRLRWWADNAGERGFPATGRLPRVEASGEARKAVGA